MTDSDQAFDVFTDVLSSSGEARAVLELEHCKRHHRVGRFDPSRLSHCTERHKLLIGEAAIEVYRNHTGTRGAIDWDDFKKWCHDHPKILALGVALKAGFVLLLFLL